MTNQTPHNNWDIISWHIGLEVSAIGVKYPESQLAVIKTEQCSKDITDCGLSVNRAMTFVVDMVKQECDKWDELHNQTGK